MMDAAFGSWATALVSARSGERSGLQHSPLPVADAPWMVQYNLDPERGDWLLSQLPKRAWTLWRYRELLPQVDEQARVDLGEGGTPLLRLRHLFKSAARLLIKEESYNPTGSFKARGLSLAVNRARDLGAPGVQLPSAGNAAVAAAAYAAAAGLPCRIALPLDTPKTIAARCRQYGCEVIEAGKTLLESGQRLADDDRGFWDLSTFKEPYRVEGKKTMGYELAEQLGWRLPDWIVYPTGGGTGIVALAKAFAELEQLGLIDASRSRLVSVQMSGCAPLVEAFHSGASSAPEWADPQTHVWGLRVPRSLADFLILDALRATNGLALAVDEAAVAEMQRRAARQEGLLIGPEGAAALVGVERLVSEDRVGPEQTVVVFQTGHPGNYA